MTPQEKGRQGGKNRSKAMTAEERSDSASKAAKARWSMPKATHTGVIELGDIGLDCYVLEGDIRVLSQTALLDAMGMKHGGNVRRPGADRMARFATGKLIKPFISESLLGRITSPIRFMGRGAATLGYPAEVLPDLCDAVLKARRAKVLQKQQLHIADRCELLMMGCTRVGVTALIDEATGFQYTRTRRALAEYLEEFLAKELCAWVKTFPDEYYSELFRIYKIPISSGSKRPQFFAQCTRDFVYERLAPGVLEELHQKNPMTSSGRRKDRHHQWLSRELGHPKLRDHLNRVIALMNVSQDQRQLRHYLDQALPKQDDHQLTLFQLVPLPPPEPL